MVFGHKKHGHAHAAPHSNAAARKLDAADGVMDGQYFGNPIVTHGRKAEVVPRAGAPMHAAPVPAGSLVPYHGRQAFPNYPGANYGYGAGYGYGAAPVAALPAYQAGYTAPSFGAVPMGSYSGYNSSALALDAADGVIDGKSFGRPIVQQSAGFSPYTASPIASTYAPAAPAYGASYAAAPAYSGFAAPAFSGFSTGASSALALDAADGVIDGKSFGRPIVQAPTAFGAGYPAASFGAVAAPAAFPASFGATAVAAPTYAAPTAFGAAPAFGATAFPQTFSAAPTYAAPAFSGVSAFPAYGAGFAAPATRAFGSTAAALDAADGVIDGKSFGRPIVQV